MTPLISGLILAAGGSTRLGRPKQLLPFRGTTLLGWVIAHVTAARALDEVIVVLGGSAAEIRTRVDLAKVRVVENPDFGQGCAGSYRTGIDALDPRADAVAVLLGDQPGVDGSLIDRVLEAWRERPNRIVAASYQSRLGHPMVFARFLFDELVALKGDKAAWKLIDAHADWVRPVELGLQYPPDINTWHDYEAALSARPSP